MSDGASQQILEEVVALRDLFQRRLLDDKAKSRMYEELYTQLEATRGGLAHQMLSPLCRDILLVVDRVRSLIPEEGDAVLESIIDELQEILQRQGVRPVDCQPLFNPLVHEAVKVEASMGTPAGSVVEVVRPGYLLGEQLLRPARVVISKSVGVQPAPPQPDAPAKEP